MDNYRKLAKKLIANFNADRNGVLQLSSELCLDCKRGANAITDLLERAEAAEAAQEKLQRAMEEYKEHAEKAQRERDEAVSDLETIMIFGDSGLDTCDFCKNNQCYARSGNNSCLPKWRGIKEE